MVNEFLEMIEWIMKNRIFFGYLVDLFSFKAIQLRENFNFCGSGYYYIG